MKRNFKKNRPQERSFYKIFGLILLGLICLACIYIWQRMEVVRLSKKIGDLKKQIAQEQITYKYLAREVAVLSQGEWIEKIALNHLEMQYSSLNQIQLISEKNLDSKNEEKLAQSLNQAKTLVYRTASFNNSDTIQKNDF